MCLWQSGIVSVSHAGDSEFEPSNLFKIILFLSLNSLKSVKTFRKNSSKPLFPFECIPCMVIVMIEREGKTGRHYANTWLVVEYFSDRQIKMNCEDIGQELNQ